MKKYSIKDWKWLIAKAGLTQTEFCKKVKMHDGHLSLIMSGKIKPKQETVDKVVNALKKLGV